MSAKFSFICMKLVKSNIFPAFCVFCGIYIECFIGCGRIYINKMASYSQIMSELLRKMNWKWLTNTLPWYI